MPKTERASCTHSKLTNARHHLAPTHSACAWRPCRALDPLARGAPRGSVPMPPRLTVRRLDKVGFHLAGHPQGDPIEAHPLPRKEVIQPQLPLRLPCYDFVPITSPALDGCPW